MPDYSQQIGDLSPEQLQRLGQLLGGPATRLRAFVTPHPGSSISAEELRQHLLEQLPSQFVPSTIEILDALPRLPNGKVDRSTLARRLPSSLHSEPEEQREFSEKEAALLDIWRAVLGTVAISIHDDFFEIGGDSILSMQVISRARSTGITLTPQEFADHPTIAELVKLGKEPTSPPNSGQPLDAQPVSQSSPEIVPLSDRSSPHPVSASQRQLWYIDQLEGPSAVYNIGESLRLQGPIDLPALSSSLGAVIARHEALRTTLALDEEGMPVQYVSTSQEPALELVNLEELAMSDRESRAMALAKEWVNQAFDLAQGRLWHIALIRIAEEEHVLVAVMHHTIADGWSYGILWDDWSEAYAAILEQRDPRFSALPLHFADYAVWEHRQSQTGAWDPLLKEWKRELAGAPQKLEVPSDKTRPAQLTFEGARSTAIADALILKKIDHVRSQTGCSLYAVLLCAWKVLLARFSGQHDLVIGSPIALRDHPDLEGVFGFLINTLPLRSRFEDDPTLHEALMRVRETVLETLSRSTVPFDRIVHELQPDRSLSYHPIFQVGLALEQRGENRLQLEQVVTNSIPLETDTSRFDLMLWLCATPDELLISLEYRTELFSKDTADHLVDLYKRLLASIDQCLDLPISHIDLLSERERTTLDHWNETSRPFSLDRTTKGLVEEQAKRIPDREAVIFGETRLTYRQLDRRANFLAHRLRERGVNDCDLVGVYLERSTDMLVILLAIWKAGAAYVPLDPAYPPERVEMILEDAQPKLLVTQENLLKGLNRDGRNLFSLAEHPSQEESDNPPSHSSGVNDLAYVIFTSGSTGRPKGVEIQHEALANFLHSMAEAPGLTEEDSLLAVTTLSFDIAALELWLPLITGARTVIASAETAMDGQALAQALDAEGITILQATPISWHLLLDAGWKGNNHLKALCGGEAMPSELVERLLPRCGELWNLYGPTETTIWSTIHQMKAGGSVLIGRPIANTQVYIVNEAVQRQPMGAPGELLIGGTGLARGYLNIPQLTAEKFISNPFGEGRLYRTGDLARFQPDGTIECLGRLDSQVKIRGFRIELGEIEHAIVECENVKDCVVSTHQDENGVAYLAAFAIPVSSPLAPTTIRKAIRSKLPDYMIPRFIVELAAFPQTPNGKIDRKALPAPAGAQSIPTKAPPETPTELRLAQIWEEILELKAGAVGRNDNFFELGGHSLLAVRMITLVQNELGRRIQPREVTLETLSKISQDLDRNSDPIEPADKDKGLLSRLHKRR